MISKEDLIFALDNSASYSGEVNQDILSVMAENLLEMCFIEKNEAHSIWQPETEEPTIPPIEVPVTPPPKPVE
jgi:hypothetical protein